MLYQRPTKEAWLFGEEDLHRLDLQLGEEEEVPGTELLQCTAHGRKLSEEFGQDEVEKDQQQFQVEFRGYV